MLAQQHQPRYITAQSLSLNCSSSSSCVVVPDWVVIERYCVIVEKVCALQRTNTTSSANGPGFYCNLKEKTCNVFMAGYGKELVYYQTNHFVWWPRKDWNALCALCFSTAKYAETLYIVFFCSCAALPFVTRTHRQQPHSDSVALSNQPTTTTTESSVMPISCS